MIYTDQMGRRLELLAAPRRIISLVPSQTELLFHLGLDDHIVGITRYCVHPADRVGKPDKIGGTKKFNFAAIDRLRPDLIIGNKEENYPEGIDRLSANYPVWMSDIRTLDDAISMIRSLGRITGRETASRTIVDSIEDRFANLPACNELSTAYLIWNNPLMVAAAHTFIDEMIRRCGLRNHFPDRERYPEIESEELASAQLILLPSEPFPFTAEHRQEFQRRYPRSQVRCVDGQLFSWYGSRLRMAPAYFRDLCKSLDRAAEQRRR